MPIADLEPHWSWFFDDAVPRHVKRRLSPREAWRDKPFTRQDAVFQVRAVRELSERLTVERSSTGGRARTRGYLQHERFRAAYLLYFLPLQTAKFAHLLAAYPGAVDAALAEARRVGRMVVADLGAGPGTASIALLLELARRFARPAKDRPGLPPIELHWFDVEKRILEHGRDLAAELIDHVPVLRGNVRIELHVRPWTDAGAVTTEGWSLGLLGHTLNESPAPPLHAWKRLLDRTARGGGLLLVEPASKGSSQRLSRLRDELLESGTVTPQPTSFWGPCLHGGACPLATGRDWCHASVPTAVPGEWFAFFSRGLGSERSWLKYSYLWLAAPSDPAPMPLATLRRVVSDPLRGSGPQQVLLCEPERTVRVPIAGHGHVLRGELLKLSNPVPATSAARPSPTRRLAR